MPADIEISQSQVNDAFLIAETLQVEQFFGQLPCKHLLECSQRLFALMGSQAHMGFRHENICVLHDVYPGQKKSLKACGCLQVAYLPLRAGCVHTLHLARWNLPNVLRGSTFCNSAGPRFVWQIPSSTNCASLG